jgi:hypothetical protein
MSLLSRICSAGRGQTCNGVGQANAMNTFKAVELDSGRWAVERFVNGESQGIMSGRYADKAEADYMIHVFARLEMSGAPN